MSLSSRAFLFFMDVSGTSSKVKDAVFCSPCSPNMEDGMKYTEKIQPTIQKSDHSEMLRHSKTEHIVLVSVKLSLVLKWIVAVCKHSHVQVVDKLALVCRFLISSSLVSH